MGDGVVSQHMRDIGIAHRTLFLRQQEICAHDHHRGYCARAHSSRMLSFWPRAHNGANRSVALFVASTTSRLQQKSPSCDAKCTQQSTLSCARLCSSPSARSVSCVGSDCGRGGRGGGRDLWTYYTGTARTMRFSVSLTRSHGMVLRRDSGVPDVARRGTLRASQCSVGFCTLQVAPHAAQAGTRRMHQRVDHGSGSALVWGGKLRGLRRSRWWEQQKQKQKMRPCTRRGYSSQDGFGGGQHFPHSDQVHNIFQKICCSLTTVAHAHVPHVGVPWLY